MKKYTSGKFSSFLLIILLALSVKSVNANPSKIEGGDIGTILGNKKLLEKINWSDPSSSELFKSRDWKNYDGESNPNTKILKKSNFVFENIEYEVNFINVGINSASPWYQITAFQKQPEHSNCQSAIHWLGKTLGPPDKTQDISYNLTSDRATGSFTRATDITQQWNVQKNTRVTLSCAGLTAKHRSNGEHMQVVNIVFSSQNNQDRIKDLIHLVCRIGLKESDNNPKKSEDVSREFVISENAKKVMNAEYEPVANNVEIGSKEIKFDLWANKNRIIRSEINRATGAFSGKLLLDNSDTLGRPVTLAGSCDKKQFKNKF